VVHFSTGLDSEYGGFVVLILGPETEDEVFETSYSSGVLGAV